MPQHGRRYRAHVFTRHVVTAPQNRSRLASQNQKLRRAQRGAPRHPLIHKVRCSRCRRSAGVDQAHGITGDNVRRRHLLHQTLKRSDLIRRHYSFEVVILRRGGLLDHRDFIFFRQVANLHIEHEAIELRFRQRVRTLHLDRVLGGQNKKWPRQIVTEALHRHAPLLHRFQQCRLGLGWRAIDFVSQHDIREQRPANELHGPVSRSAILFDYFCPRDVSRHQVRRKLNALERKIEHTGHRAD